MIRDLIVIFADILIEAGLITESDFNNRVEALTTELQEAMLAVEKEVIGD